MNVYIFIWNFEVGGAQKFVIKLANALHRRGVGVTMLVANPSGAFRSLLNQEVKIVKFQIPKTNNPIKIWKCYKRLTQICEPNSMFVVNGPNNFRQLSRLNLIFRQWNIVVRLHNDIVIKPSFLSVLKRIEMRLLFNQKKVRVLAMSDKQCESHRDIYRLKRIQHIPNFFPEIQSDEENRPDPREGIKAVCLARFSPEKGYQYLIPALAEIKSGLHVDIYGDGPMKEELVALARSLNLSNVSFLSPVIEVNDILPKYHFLIMPSTYETFGNVIIEAFRHGLPVVSTDCDGPLNFVVKNKNGLLAEKGNIISLANKIGEMYLAIHNNDFDSDTIKNSVSEKYSEEFVINSYLKLFK